jgi:hypothetical protein
MVIAIKIKIADEIVLNQPTVVTDIDVTIEINISSNKARIY